MNLEMYFCGSPIMNKANFSEYKSSKLKSLVDNKEDIWTLLVIKPKACLKTDRMPPLVSVGARIIDDRFI